MKNYLISSSTYQNKLSFLWCLVGPDEIMQYLDPSKKSTGEYVQGSGTFTGNPLATTAGLAALNVLEKPGTYESLYLMADRLSSNLEKICKSL